MGAGWAGWPSSVRHCPARRHAAHLARCPVQAMPCMQHHDLSTSESGPWIVARRAQPRHAACIEACAVAGAHLWTRSGDLAPMWRASRRHTSVLADKHKRIYTTLNGALLWGSCRWWWCVSGCVEASLRELAETTTWPTASCAHEDMNFWPMFREALLWRLSLVNDASYLLQSPL